MKILALESSAVSASVALTEDDKLIAQSFQNCGLTHSRTLLPMAEALLANCGVSLSEVDAFCPTWTPSPWLSAPAPLPACASALRQSRVSRSARTGRASAYRRSRPWPGARALSAAVSAASWTPAPVRYTMRSSRSTASHQGVCAMTARSK